MLGQYERWEDKLVAELKKLGYERNCRRMMNEFGFANYKKMYDDGMSPREVAKEIVAECEEWISCESTKVSKAIKLLKECKYRIVEDAYTDAMDAEDDEYLAKIKAKKAITDVRAPRRAKPTMGNNPYKVGDILMMHWGYSMCLYDYFKVVKVTPSSVGLVELKDMVVKGHRNGQYYNAPSDEIETHPTFCNADGSPTMKRVGPDGSVSFGHTGVAVKWDGEPKYCDDMD